MSYFKVTSGGIFSLTSAEEVEIVDKVHSQIPPTGTPMYHVYSFHVKAKFDPGSLLTMVSNPIASAPTPFGVISQPMLKISGDPTDFYYKTASPISFGGPTPYALPITATAKATFVTTETISADSAPTTLP